MDLTKREIFAIELLTGFASSGKDFTDGTMDASVAGVNLAIPKVVPQKDAGDHFANLSVDWADKLIVALDKKTEISNVDAAMVNVVL